MGYGNIELTITATLAEHATERECEELAWWLDLVTQVQELVNQRAGPIADRSVGLSAHPHPAATGAWTVFDWRAGRPCGYQGSHQHDPGKAPPDVLIAPWGQDGNGARHTIETARMVEGR
jgi:hypothetical protein